MPIARGWGTGGLQATLSLIGPDDVVKVIDQGADDSVNAANLRRFLARVSGARTTTDALAATLIQSRHRVPEEILTDAQTLVLQVPIPEPLRSVEPSIDRARRLHAVADYGVLWLSLYEQVVRYRRYTHGASYPLLVHERYVMDPSPIPRWDVRKLHRAKHLTILAAGREKRIYAVPPQTDVRPLHFDDVPFAVEDQRSWRCARTGAGHQFMNEIPLPGGGVRTEIGDSGYVEKLLRGVAPADTYYDQDGAFRGATRNDPRGVR
jgi:alpha-D-ribose 1-methylphosphonate 5-phosphate C-P lyase